jgi:type I restriction enzyme R subunit
MIGCFETFDVGFFDLIIADESHRSIYNKYRDLFLYFDALQIGLTATPVQLIDRNTFSLFLCEDGMPTVNYELKTAVDEGFLVPPRVESFTTEFQRDGIKWDDLSPDQQKQLEEQLDDAEHAAYESKDLDRLIFNKDTNRVILRNLMEQGRHHPDGTLGKTILFARNHAHAKLLKELFDKAWPAFGGGFCQVIDHYNPKAEQLIDDFKGQGRNNDIVLAISVDMLDTGIDVPEIVNLVFAKPVGSYVKFWQMIGRGTRLCPDLFGPGKDKKDFLIIDHWGNFDHFGVDFKQPAGSIPKSLLQRVFEARLELAATSRAAGNEASLQAACELLGHDLAALEETKALEVREHAVELRRVSSDEALHKLDPITKATLEQEIAPLMRWRPVYGQEPAYRFDKLVALLQREVVTPSGRFDDLKGELINQVNGLQTNLSQVKAKDETIKLVRSEEFWKEPSVAKLESVRGELRSIMQFRQGPHTPRPGPVVVDVAEESGEFQLRKKKFPLDGLELVAYRKRVEEVFEELFDESPALQKIKAGKPVTEAELAELIDDVLRLDASLDLDQLRLIFPKTKGHLDRAIRRIIGLDAKQVEARFADFVQSHTALTSQQVHFLRLLQSHIAHYGAVELEQLYEAPFTTIHNEGVDGVFTDKAQVDDLLSIISTFETPQEETSQ